MSVCLSVCLCVCECTTGHINWHTKLKFRLSYQHTFLKNHFCPFWDISIFFAVMPLFRVSFCDTFLEPFIILPSLALACSMSNVLPTACENYIIINPFFGSKFPTKNMKKYVLCSSTVQNQSNIWNITSLNEFHNCIMIL